MNRKRRRAAKAKNRYQRRAIHDAKCRNRNRQIVEGHFEDDTRDRIHLVNCNEGALQRAARAAERSGLDNPVIVVADLRDPIAYQLATPLVSTEKIDALIAKERNAGRIPTLIFASPRDAFIELTDVSHPNTSATLRKLPENDRWFPVIAIGAGGLTLVTMPICVRQMEAS